MKRKLIWAAVFVLLACIAFYYFYPEEELPAGVKVDNIVVLKSKREMLAYSKGQLVRTYKVSLSSQSTGDKEFEGDKKTPEGVYFINDKNPNSGYHKNLGVSYPDSIHIEKAKRFGKSAGGDIKIHGIRNYMGFIGKFHRWRDWTLGCIALTDWEIDELYDAVDIGTRIEIKP
ncbi:MAG: L,D-transpeptidase family protein [Ignavibacteria bacterium]|nr:L,D-transpeptidase family protein [Ignavibacteria bacterium]